MKVYVELVVLEWVVLVEISYVNKFVGMGG